MEERNLIHIEEDLGGLFDFGLSFKILQLFLDGYKKKQEKSKEEKERNLIHIEEDSNSSELGEKQFLVNEHGKLKE